MGLAHSPKILTDGLVSLLDAGNTKSYPGSGTTWTDLIGSNDGTLNGPTFNSANGGAILFDGSNNDRVTISNDSSLSFTTTFSLSCWFNFSTLPDGEVPLLRKEMVWQLGFQNSNTIRCLIQTDVGVSGWTAANDVTYYFATNTWYNMTMTYRGSGLYGNNMLIYVNAELVKAATVTGDVSNNTNDVQVGYHSGKYLDGRMSNLSIYNKTLTAAEITQNYTALKGRYGY